MVSQEGEQSCICVIEVSIFPLSTIFLLYFRNVLTVWYFITVLTVWYFRNVLTVWYFRNVLTVWYFRNVLTVWYFRNVLTVWYFRNVLTVLYFRNVLTVWYSLFSFYSYYYTDSLLLVLLDIPLILDVCFAGKCTRC